MSFQAFPRNWTPNALIDPKTGVPNVDGKYLFLALFNRSGASDGIIPVVNSSGTPQTPIVAAGNSQATATLLQADWNNVATVPVGSGVIIPPMKPGNDISVWNNSANALLVYPFTGAQIGNRAVNAPFSLAAGLLAYWQCWTTTQLLTIISVNPLL